MRSIRAAQKRFVVVCIVPIIGVFTLFMFLPLGLGLGLSFFKYNLMFPSHPFVGINNYQKLFRDPYATSSLLRTLIFLIYKVPLCVGVPLVLALLLENRKGKNFFRTVYFLPAVMSGVCVALLWKFIYSPVGGLLNAILGIFGFKKIGWLSDPSTALISIILVDFWQSFGLNTIILLAGLDGIPNVFYEVAQIDGASRWKVTLHITLPLLRRVLVFAVTIALISSFKVFDIIWVMTSGTAGPMNSTRLFAIDIYMNAFQNLKFGYASAEAVFLLFIVLGLTLTEMHIGRQKWEF